MVWGSRPTSGEFWGWVSISAVVQQFPSVRSIGEAAKGMLSLISALCKVGKVVKFTDCIALLKNENLRKKKLTFSFQIFTFHIVHLDFSLCFSSRLFQC